jgi:membrane-associated phospholipid phosphatase
MMRISHHTAGTGRPRSLSSPWRDALSAADRGVLRVTRRRLGATPAVAVAEGLSSFGAHAAGWLLIGAAGVVRGRRRNEWLVATTGVVVAHGTGVVVKRIVRRERPQLPDVPALVATAGRLSFPSAHACSTAAAAVGYAPFFGRPVMAAALAAMSVSRVLLGVHYPSDVAAGVVVGAVCARMVRTGLARSDDEVPS